MTNILEVNDLHVSFNTYAGEVQAIRGVSFHLKKGEVLAIVGESGSGKSVTAKTLMQLNPPSITEIKSGEILFDGKDLTKLTDAQMQKIRGADISMVFQDPMTALNPTMTIGKQIMENLRKHLKMNSVDATKRAAELLELVGITNPEARLKQYPHQFSGGMRQRIVIAIALASNPKVLIADEPTTALDVSIQAQILELLKKLQQQMELSIIFITHDLGVVAKMAERVAVMYAGKIVEIGTTDEVFYDPRHPYTWGLLAAMPNLDTKDEYLYTIPGTPPNLLYPPVGDAFADRNKQALKIDFVEEPPLFKVTDTHYAATWLLHPQAPAVERPSQATDRQEKVRKVKSSEKLLEVRGLKQYFKLDKHSTVKALDGISFDIFKGEIFGLVGESGCGKSTTGRSIIRLYDATDGEIIYKGKNIREVKGRELAKQFNKEIQMIFQDPYSSLNPRIKVSDIISEGLLIHGYKEEEREAKVYELLETVGLNKEHANRYPHEFSGGQRQRIGIARALAVNPEFIIADEPISALDVSIQAQIVNLLKHLQKEKGLTYLFIAHDLSMVKYISDRIGVMYRGKIVELAESDELYNNPIHPYTKALLSAVPLPDPSLERTKTRIKFDDQAYFSINRDNETLREVSEGHFVTCVEEEFEQYVKQVRQ